MINKSFDYSLRLPYLVKDTNNKYEIRSMQFSKTILFIALALSLSACEALDTAFDGVSGAFDSVLDTSGPSTKKLRGDPVSAFASKCPKINIVEELNTLGEFTDPTHPKESNLISHVTMKQLDSSCEIEDSNVIIDIKLAFNSTLGKKAKIRNNDKPFFAYPFFVAITDVRGTILAKEVFAASMTYNRNESKHTYYENIRQIIPIKTRRSAGSYSVYLGFQLSDEQLAYNRKNIQKAPKAIQEIQSITTDQNAPEILHPQLQSEE